VGLEVLDRNGSDHVEILIPGVTPGLKIEPHRIVFTRPSTARVFDVFLANCCMAAANPNAAEPPVNPGRPGCPSIRKATSTIDDQANLKLTIKGAGFVPGQTFLGVQIEDTTAHVETLGPSAPRLTITPTRITLRRQAPLAIRTVFSAFVANCGMVGVFTEDLSPST